MYLISVLLAAALGYLAGTKRLLRFLMPQNPLTKALDQEQEAMQARLVQSVLQQMRTQAPAPGNTPPSAN